MPNETRFTAGMEVRWRDCDGNLRGGVVLKSGITKHDRVLIRDGNGLVVPSAAPPRPGD